MKRWIDAVAVALFVLLSGCRGGIGSSDPYDRSATYDPNAPTVRDMNAKVQLGMSADQVIAALGKHYNGGVSSSNNNGTSNVGGAMTYHGSDGGLGILFKDNRVTDIQPMPKRGRADMQPELAKVRPGMTLVQVWGALGDPDGTEDMGDRRRLRYTYHDGYFWIELPNDRVSETKTYPPDH